MKPPTEASQDLQETEGTTESHDPNFTFSVELASSNASNEAGEHSDNEPPPSAQSKSSESLESSIVAERSSSGASGSSDPSIPAKKPESDRKKARSADPIHWYGILVPQSLRRAQTSFTGAIDNQVPDLASTTIEMRALEQQIRKLRARLEAEPSAIEQWACPTLHN